MAALLLLQCCSTRKSRTRRVVHSPARPLFQRHTLASLDPCGGSGSGTFAHASPRPSDQSQVWLALVSPVSPTSPDRYIPPHPLPSRAFLSCLVLRDASRSLSHGQEETRQPASQPALRLTTHHRSSSWTSFGTNVMPPRRAPAPAPTLAPPWARERAWASHTSHTPPTPPKPPAPAPTVHATPAARGSRDVSRSPARTSVSCARSTAAPAHISTSPSGGRGQRPTAWQASPRPQSTAGRAPIRKSYLPPPNRIVANFTPSLPRSPLVQPPQSTPSPPHLNAFESRKGRGAT
jgi:hypothetical protein